MANSLAEVFRRYGPTYLQKFGNTVPIAHRNVMHAIEHCRSGSFGHAVYRCDACGTTHYVGRSCGNRHCPTCQQHKVQSWLGRELDQLLPCEYFLVTFTMRPELRRVVRSKPAVAYTILFQAATAALAELAADPRHMGAARLGFLAVLHTWGRTLEYHPHIHVVVPAGGLSADGTRWCPCRPGFFLPVRALSVLFRAKVRDLMKQAGLGNTMDRTIWQSPWVVHVQPVGDGRHALEYLSRYVFRVAISNARIISCDDGRVQFRYKKSGRRNWSTMSLEAHEFIRRFLQHVVPSGFQRVRHYGFLSPASKHSIAEVRRRVEDFTFQSTLTATALAVAPALPRPVTCPTCGGMLHLVAIALPWRLLVLRRLVLRCDRQRAAPRVYSG